MPNGTPSQALTAEERQRDALETLREAYVRRMLQGNDTKMPPPGTAEGESRGGDSLGFAGRLFLFLLAFVFFVVIMNMCYEGKGRGVDDFP